MSDILIKNLKMPTSCMDCPFKGFDRASGRGNICTIDESITLHAVLDGLDVKFVKMGDCPLIKVPPPHGRLIDADAMNEKYGDWYTEEGTEEGFIGTLKYLIAEQQTIIEAEGT